MREREFWREPTAGHVFAVELDDGVVTGGCGPLDGDDIDPRFLATFDYSAEQGVWLEEHRAELDLYPLALPLEPYASLQPALALRPVASAMHAGVVTCRPDATLLDVARTMANVGIHAVVVEGDGGSGLDGSSGVVSDLDLVSAAARGDELAGTAVGAARTEVVTVDSRETLLHAANLMERQRVTHLVVVDSHSRPIGVLSTLDVARAIARYA